MKTIVACVWGLAALVTSFASGGSPVYADALEAESSALPILAPDADTNRVGSLDKLHCVFYSDGADNCVVNVQLEAVDQRSTAVSEIDQIGVFIGLRGGGSPPPPPVSEIDPPATGSAPAIQFVDAVPVAVVQTVTIAAPGLNAGDGKETANTGPMLAPATEPALGLDAKTTTSALVAPAGQSADAIVVAIVQSATIAVPGQSEETAQAESISDPTAPISTRQAKATALDYAE
jgi:hypothetical protein